MHDGPDFLRNLAVLLTVAAATTVLFQRLRQPVVLGYLLAGLIVGPYVAVPLVVDPGFAHTVSDLGVILLMFSLGLEFSLRKLVKAEPTAGIVAVIQCSLMIWIGYATARALGWTSLESIFTGALIAISSTTIIVKAFEEQGIRGKVADIVFGVLIVEDLIAILLLAVLTALAQGSGLSAAALTLTVGRLGAFLAGLLVVGMLVIPRLMRFIVRLGRPETTVVASIGLCFAISLLARSFGYSVALGAFLAGSLVAESGEAKTIEHLIQPVRDLFAAIFFVAVGMLIQPRLVAENWGAVLILTVVVVVGKIFGVALAAFLSGNGIRTSVRTGMSLAQIGEFSFIIAGVGLSLGVVRPGLYPIAVAVSAVTTLTTPWLIRASGGVASYIDRHLPRPLQTFAALYGSWVEQLRTAPAQRTVLARFHRTARLLLVDVSCVAAIVIGTSLGLPRLVPGLESLLGLQAGVARWLVIGLAGALCLPFAVGAGRLAHSLGLGLAAQAFPAGTGKLDRAAAPRRVLVSMLQLTILLLAGIPLVAVTQPFLPPFRGAVVLAVAVVLLAIAFWRSTANLQGHVRAGVQVIAEALGKQARGQERAATGETADPVDAVRGLLPGLGEPTAVRLADASTAVGRSLAQLDLRGLTGATVLAITRGGKGVLVPGGHEVLQGGDVLALAGSHEAVEAAKALLAS